MRIRDRVVRLPAGVGARALALGLLDEAAVAAKRLAAGKGEEPLHDFRVAVRRLRTALRSLRPWLRGAAGRQSEKKLQKLARATSAPRDAEVQLAWLAATRPRVSAPSQRAGYAFAVARLEERLEGRRHLAGVAHRLDRIAAKLRRRLRASDQAHPGGGESFGAVVAALVRDHTSALTERVAAIRDAADQDAAHRARIAAKRLRYLLEPLRGYGRADASTAIARLKGLQEVLGDLHDAHVLGGELGKALAQAAAERARQLHAALLVPARPHGRSLRQPVSSTSTRPGLVALTRLARLRRDARFAELEREWRPGDLDAIAAEARAIAAALDARVAAPPGASPGVTRRNPARRPPARKAPASSSDRGRRGRAAPHGRP